MDNETGSNFWRRQSNPNFPMLSGLTGVINQSTLCSMIHSIVHEFRVVHGLNGGNSSSLRESVVESYRSELVESPQREVIEELSDPTTYAALRHGGRFSSPYPPLTSEALEACCKEIRAALVWRALQ